MDKQKGRTKVVITPEMIEAAAEVLRDYLGDSSDGRSLIEVSQAAVSAAISKSFAIEFTKGPSA